MAVLVPALVRLRAEFNVLAPGRDKASDGWIGNRAHELSQSDHNDDETGNVPIRDADTIHEVHAIDVDNDLRLPGVTMEDAVQHILARCRAGTERRLRYIIYNRRIWSASAEWRQRDYDGDNPHDHHAHFSGAYVTALESDTSSWHMEDIDMPTANEIAAETVRQLRPVIANEVARQVAAFVDDIATAVASVQVDVNPGGETPNRQPWARVDAYGSKERKEILRAVWEVGEAVAAVAAQHPHPAP